MRIHLPGQVPIQAGSFSDLSHPNGNSLPSQMQHLGGLHMGSDFEQTRQQMRDCIFQLIRRGKRRGKRTTPVTVLVPIMQEMARCLEEVLYKNASTKEEYINMNTLEQRLQICVRSASRSQQLAHSISSSSVGTMMPTPGMTQRRNSNSIVSSSAGNSTIPVSINKCNTGVVDTINTRRLLSTSNGSTAGVSFSASDDKSTYAGSISNGHQHSPANISMSSGVNGPILMVPTPGLSNTNRNSEPFNSAGIKSTNLIKPQQTKQYAGGHNSHILHNLGGQMGSGLRSTLQQYSFPNDTPIGALGSTVTNIQSVHTPSTSRVCCISCAGTLPLQMIHMTDLSAPEKLCGTRMPVGSTVNDQNLNQIVHSNLQTSDQSSTMTFQSHQASKIPQQELHRRPPSCMQLIKLEEFHRRITGQDEAQLPHLSSNGPITSHTSASRLHSTQKASNSSAFSRENAIPPSCMLQIKWLLFLQHARRCSAPEGKCLDANCIKAQPFLKHTEGCPLDHCSYPRCHATKVLIQHVRKCQSPVCPVCVPFHCFSQSHIKPRICAPSDQDFKNSINGSQKGSDAEDAAQLTMSASALTVEPSEDLQSQNNNGCTTAGGNSESVLHGQRQDKMKLSYPHLSSNGPITSHTSASRLH